MLLTKVAYGSCFEVLLRHIGCTRWLFPRLTSPRGSLSSRRRVTSPPLALIKMKSIYKRLTSRHQWAHRFLAKTSRHKNILALTLVETLNSLRWGKAQKKKTFHFSLWAVSVCLAQMNPSSSVKQNQCKIGLNQSKCPYRVLPPYFKKLI